MMFTRTAVLLLASLNAARVLAAHEGKKPSRDTITLGDKFGDLQGTYERSPTEGWTKTHDTKGVFQYYHIQDGPVLRKPTSKRHIMYTGWKGTLRIWGKHGFAYECNLGKTGMWGERGTPADPADILEKKLPKGNSVEWQMSRHYYDLLTDPLCERFDSLPSGESFQEKSFDRTILRIAGQATFQRLIPEPTVAKDQTVKEGSRVRVTRGGYIGWFGILGRLQNHLPPGWSQYTAGPGPNNGKPFYRYFSQVSNKEGEVVWENPRKRRVFLDNGEKIACSTSSLQVVE